MNEVDQPLPGEFLPAQHVGLNMRDVAKAFNIGKKTAKRLVREMERQRVFKSACGSYQVNVAETTTLDGSEIPMVHLSIKRCDRQPIRDWRVLQSIKNAILGPEREAVELFPAESRLVDTANQWHLFAFANPIIAFPFGWTERGVTDAPGGKAVQRPLADGQARETDHAALLEDPGWEGLGADEQRGRRLAVAAYIRVLESAARDAADPDFVIGMRA